MSSSFYSFRYFVVLRCPHLRRRRRDVCVRPPNLRVWWPLEANSNLHTSGVRNETGLCRTVGVECHAPRQIRSDCQLAPRHDTPTSEMELKLQRFELWRREGGCELKNADADNGSDRMNFQASELAASCLSTATIIQKCNMQIYLVH
ncbi:hypothetical protein ACLKA7_003845 [Drosophila subpalustris]